MTIISLEDFLPISVTLPGEPEADAPPPAPEDWPEPFPVFRAVVCAVLIGAAMWAAIIWAVLR